MPRSPLDSFLINTPTFVAFVIVFATQDFSETTKDLEQFVTEIGTVETMMRSRLMELVRALEGQNRQDRAAKAHMETLWQRLTQRHGTLEAEHAALVERFQAMEKHLKQAVLANDALMKERRELLLERDLLQRRLMTAIQYGQISSSSSTAEAAAAAATTNSNTIAAAAQTQHQHSKFDVAESLLLLDKQIPITTRKPSPPSIFSKRVDEQDDGKVRATIQQAVAENEDGNDEENGAVDEKKPSSNVAKDDRAKEKSRRKAAVMVSLPDILPKKPRLDTTDHNHQQRTTDQSTSTAQQLPLTAPLPRCQYICPIGMCPKNFWIPRKYNPPLNEQGNITDKVPWNAQRLGSFIQVVTRHLEQAHGDVPEEDWPRAFRIDDTETDEGSDKEEEEEEGSVRAEERRDDVADGSEDLECNEDMSVMVV